MSDTFRIPRGLIVSCQGPAGTPLDDPGLMAAIAACAELAGAVAIRAQGVADLRQIRQTVTIALVGLIKHRLPDTDVYITPAIEDALAVAAAGADVVAVDATDRPRPDGSGGAEFVERVRSATGLPVMADVSTLAEGTAAAQAGAAYISTTLSGYTPYSRQLSGPDLRLVEELVGRTDTPVTAEGRYWTPGEAAEALRRGAHAVVIGTAITNPLEIARRFATALGEALTR
ncbi:MAG: putative N-acetylmannosamine-6-phosphate 2-epimerase [Chloroflexi bacterium]|nr:MAG: putative N-acetylmannosamine-6-phosphate 2-epimerase [Chloroflexota bacterium]